MSIVCFTGLPGDGKSYSAVENFIIPALKDGRHVAHNLMLNEAALEVVCERKVGALLHQIGKDDTPAQLIEKCPSGAVVVIDEVWRYWPCGVKANEVPKEELKFFKEHRHRTDDKDLTTEILIIDQDPKTGIPAFLRSLIETTYVHTKHSKVGASGRFRCDIYARCQSAASPSKGNLLRSMQGRYRPQVWNCYISHTQSKRLGEAGLERMVDARANILKGWTVRSAVIAGVLLPVIMWGAWNRVHAMAGADKPARRPAKVHAQPRQQSAPEAAAASASKASAAAAPPAAAVEPAKPAEPGWSPTWRVLGVMTKDKDSSGRVLLGSSSGHRLYDAKDCEQDKAGNWRCLVEGFYATMWSGGSSPLSAAVPDGMHAPGAEVVKRTQQVQQASK